MKCFYNFLFFSSILDLKNIQIPPEMLKKANEILLNKIIFSGTSLSSFIYDENETKWINSLFSE